MCPWCFRPVSELWRLRCWWWFLYPCCWLAGGKVRSTLTSPFCTWIFFCSPGIINQHSNIAFYGTRQSGQIVCHTAYLYSVSVHKAILVVVVIVRKTFSHTLPGSFLEVVQRNLLFEGLRSRLRIGIANFFVGWYLKTVLVLLAAKDS